MNVDPSRRYDPSTIVVCPYDEVHTVTISRLPYHLLKCAKVRKLVLKSLVFGHTLTATVLAVAHHSKSILIFFAHVHHQSLLQSDRTCITMTFEPYSQDNACGQNVCT